MTLQFDSYFFFERAHILTILPSKPKAWKRKANKQTQKREKWRLKFNHLSIFIAAKLREFTKFDVLYLCEFWSYKSLIFNVLFLKAWIKMFSIQPVEPRDREIYKITKFWNLIAILFHEQNLNSYLILNKFALYLSYVSPTSRKIMHVSIFLGYTA